MTESCETCKFWRLSVSYPKETGAHVKECHRNAPIPAYPMYPRTVAADWCGEFDPMDPNDKDRYHKPHHPPPEPSEGGLSP